MASKLKKLSVAADIFEQSVDGSIRKIPLSQIHPSSDQPRQEKDVNVSALAESLKADGLLQPIVVTKTGNSEFHIIAGERRYRAATSLGWSEIECRILHREGREKFRLAVIENLQRENLDSVEEARAFARLKREFNYSDQELATVIGKSRNYINEILSINDLPEEIILDARKTGLSQKNMFVQLAIANKNGHADEFLSAYKNGEIGTVKTAKNFNQQKKTSDTPSKPSKAASRPRSPESEPEISIQLSWASETSLTIEGQIGKLTNLDQPLELIERELTARLKELIKNS